MTYVMLKTYESRKVQLLVVLVRNTLLHVIIPIYIAHDASPNSNDKSLEETYYYSLRN